MHIEKLFENKKVIHFYAVQFVGQKWKEEIQFYISYVAVGQGDSQHKLEQLQWQPPTHPPHVAPAPLPSLVTSPSIL